MRVRWLKRANDERRAQLRYVALDNPRVADRLDEDISVQVRHLADHPRIGRSGREPGTRELVIPRTPYIVIYRIEPDQVVILRLLHGAQRWPPAPG